MPSGTTDFKGCLDAVTCTEGHALRLQEATYQAGFSLGVFAKTFDLHPAACAQLLNDIHEAARKLERVLPVL